MNKVLLNSTVLPTEREEVQRTARAEIDNDGDCVPATSGEIDNDGVWIPATNSDPHLVRKELERSQHKVGKSFYLGDILVS